MTYVSMRGITKTYPGQSSPANDGVDFDVLDNEIHALVGENGAGKSTLMNILYGLEKPDRGEICIREKKTVIPSPLAAGRLGIGMVHQHFKLIPEFTVAENMVLGAEPRTRGCFFDAAKAEEAAGRVIAAHSFHIDPRAKVSELTVGQMQQVELTRILYRQADLLILDEPTSVLTEQEIHGLFETLLRLKENGRTVIIITHKLKEVTEISDRVTVMRKGRVVAVRNTRETGRKELATLMVGRDVLFEIGKEKTACGEGVVELQAVTVLRKGQARPLLDRVSLTIRSCEILGLAGVSGNGLNVLEDVAAGLTKITSGRILHNGEDVTGLSTLALRERGLAYVPADRLNRGSSKEASIRENMIIAKHHDFLKAGIFRAGEVDSFAESLIRQFSIDASADGAMGTLSGGNVQKVILARELAGRADFIIFSEPTWGLDVASSQFVYEKIQEMRNEGAAVLLISSNLDELLGLSDTVAVMYRGRIVCLLKNDASLSKEIIGQYMLGLKDDYDAGEGAKILG